MILELKKEVRALEDIEVEGLPLIENRICEVEENLMLVARNLTDLTNVVAGNVDNGQVNSKPDAVKIGGTFETIVDCKILGLFFYKDKKYAVITPYINDNYIQIPSVVGITPDGDIDFNLGSEKDEDEVKQKALAIYREFKSSNQDEFLNPEDGE